MELGERSLSETEKVFHSLILLKQCVLVTCYLCFCEHLNMLIYIYIYIFYATSEFYVPGC